MLFHFNRRFVASFVFTTVVLTALACNSATAAEPAQPEPPAPAAPAAQVAPTVIDAPAVAAVQLPEVVEPTEVALPPTALAEPAAPVSEPVPETIAPAMISTLDPYQIVAAVEQVVTGVYRTVLPSVVRIEVQQRVTGSGGLFGSADGFQPSGEGSGFVWSDDGIVVTNHHVVAEADRVIVSFADGEELVAEVLGSDPDSDLAALRIDVPEGGLQASKLGDSDAVNVGQFALAIGNPFGQEFTLTQGIVSAIGRTIQSAEGNFSNPKAIQTDAPINPGNSGGPLLDIYGNVIGINSQIQTRSGASAGVGFAVPVNTAKRVIPELIETGEYEYAYLGVNGSTVRDLSLDELGLPDDTRGVLLQGVVRGGPADIAGLVPNNGAVGVRGDVITAVDGVAVGSMDELIAYLTENIRPGDTIDLTVIRDDGSVEVVEVTVTSRPN